MAVIDKMPSQTIIDLLAGTLDFYYWKGIACVRKWPEWKPRTPTPAEKANQDAFSYINQLWSTLPLNIQTAWNDTAAQTGLTGKDHFVRAYMKGTNV